MFSRLAVLAAVVASCGMAQGQAASALANPGYLTSEPIAGAVYDEYAAHSPVVRRSYVPAYTPSVTPYFMNPRTRPTSMSRVQIDLAICMNTYPLWHFGRLVNVSDNTGAPYGSHAYAYLRGYTGVTANLQKGYPEGQRVVEPVLVPYDSFASRSGYFINGGSQYVLVSDPRGRPVTCCPTTLGPYAQGANGQGAAAVSTVAAEK